MSTPWSWDVWGMDMFTTGWVVWILFFAVWETWALIVGTNQELTEHLRPVFLSSPPTWFLAFGLWLWLGFHFLVEAGHPIRVLPRIVGE